MRTLLRSEMYPWLIKAIRLCMVPLDLEIFSILPCRRIKDLEL
jgi:hypothetical protein